MNILIILYNISLFAGSVKIIVLAFFRAENQQRNLKKKKQNVELWKDLI